MSNDHQVNVEKTKMLIGENAWKFTGEGKFPCAVFRKSVGSNSIYFQFGKCWES